MAMRDAKRNAGIEIKRGRPAGSKKTTDITVEVKPKARKVTNSVAVVDVNEA
jgi:hypothetical protein